jgi:hypothetical protein
LDEGGAQTVSHEVVDQALLAEADLGFGGVDVDVDLFRRHFKEEEDNGERCGRKNVAIGLADGVQEGAVADEALVYEDVDGVAVELLQFGFGVEAGEAEGTRGRLGDGWVLLPGGWFREAGVVERGLCGNGEELGEGVGAEDLVDALGGAGDRGSHEQGVGSGEEFEVLFWVDEGVVGDEGDYVGEFSGLGAEELAAGRGVVEEVLDGDGGARRESCVFYAEDLAAGDLDAGAFGAGGF